MIEKLNNGHPLWFEDAILEEGRISEEIYPHIHPFNP